jgi:hypothetical protein
MRSAGPGQLVKPRVKPLVMPECVSNFVARPAGRRRPARSL